MNEHGYIRSVHRKLPDDCYYWKINDNYCGGVADTFYSAKGGPILFAEYKYIKNVPKKAETILTPKCSGLQLQWLRDRYAESIPVIVILGSPKGGVIFTTLAWEKGINQQTFLIKAIPAKKIAQIIADHCRGTIDVVTNEAAYHYKG